MVRRKANPVSLSLIFVELKLSKLRERAIKPLAKHLGFLLAFSNLPEASLAARRLSGGNSCIGAIHQGSIVRDNYACIVMWDDSRVP